MGTRPLVFKKKNIVIFTDEIGWHTDELQKELKKKHIQSYCVDLADCFFKTDNSFSTISTDLQHNILPSLAFVRGIAGGSFEQVTKRLSILHGLSLLGIPVINSAQAIEKSVDKSMTSFILKKNKIPTPDFWLTENTNQAIQIINNEISKGNRVVLKPIFGSQGRDIIRFCNKVNNKNEFQEKIGTKRSVHYIQNFVPSFGSHSKFDLRVLVINKKAVAAMQRWGNNWIHNIARGGKTKSVKLTHQLKRISENASHALGLNVAGVDLIPDPSISGGLQVIEVNGVPAWKGLQNASKINITDEIAAYLINEILN